MSSPEVTIIGAGIAGLCCALRLQQRGVSFRILEASDAPGGRIRTDVVDGFRLDRGFQVLLTAYPEAKRVLDYDALQLRTFRSGAKVFLDDRFQTVADPFRTPFTALPGVFSTIGGITDKLRVLKLRHNTLRGSLQSLLANPERATLDELRDYRFSETMIDRFFRPFLGGIFLEPALSTSSRKFEFVYRMFSEGEAAIPANGMQAIPEQIASRLAAGSIEYNTRVTGIAGNMVLTEGRPAFRASKIVLAVEQPVAMRLLQKETEVPANAVTCLYFDAPRPPIAGAWLVLDGQSQGPVNNLCVPSEVSSNYAPAGRALISATILGNPGTDIESQVRHQLDNWFGSTADWRHLRTYRILYALPAQPNGTLSPVAKNPRLGDNLYRCGDDLDIASINGAMLSGLRAADALTA